MMMNLPPCPINVAEDPARSYRHGQRRFTDFVLPALSAHDIEDVPRFMKAVVIELEPVLAGAAEDAFVYGSDFLPAALDPAHGIVHDRFIRLRPVLRHEFHV